MRTPKLMKETARGCELYFLEDSFFHNREIFMTDYVDADSSNELIKQLLYLNQENPEKEITIYINSPGGEVISGLAVYDCIRLMQAPIRTVCTGMAASMGAFLLSSGAKGKRLALPNAEVMIHQPSGGAKGQATEIQIVAENILKTKKKLNEILAANTGQSVEKIAEDTERDNFMSAEEAKAYGLIDEIVESRNAAKEKE